jgi:hypothetical protein
MNDYVGHVLIFNWEMNLLLLRAWRSSNKYQILVFGFDPTGVRIHDIQHLWCEHANQYTTDAVGLLCYLLGKPIPKYIPDN